MTTFTPDEIQEILKNHKAFINNEEGGKRANLQGANLQGVDLQGANLQGANLWQANLHGANLMGAVLLEANLMGAVLLEANLQKANLREVNLMGAALHRANLHRANLRGANLRGATLLKANLMGADLRGACLQGVSLQGVSLRGVSLLGVSLLGVNLLGATGLPPYTPDPELLGKIIDAIDANPGNFDMSTWHAPTACGTSHCLAGWAVTLHPEGLLLEHCTSTPTAAMLLVPEVAHLFYKTEPEEKQAVLDEIRAIWAKMQDDRKVK